MIGAIEPSGMLRTWGAALTARWPNSEIGLFRLRCLGWRRVWQTDPIVPIATVASTKQDRWAERRQVVSRQPEVAVAFRVESPFSDFELARWFIVRAW